MAHSIAELVLRARLKEADAFCELFRRFERVARSVAFAVVRDETSVHDVTQDGFIRAWERLDDLREPERFGMWLCGIVRNLALDRLRRSRRIEQLDTGAFPLEDRWTHDPLHEASRRESNALVAGAIADLDEVARRAIRLRYFDQMPSKQIARKLGISADAVDMRLIRARRRLRQALPANASA